MFGSRSSSCCPPTPQFGLSLLHPASLLPSLSGQVCSRTGGLGGHRGSSSSTLGRMEVKRNVTPRCQLFPDMHRVFQKVSCDAVPTTIASILIFPFTARGRNRLREGREHVPATGCQVAKPVIRSAQSEVGMGAWGNRGQINRSWKHG